MNFEMRIYLTMSSKSISP